MAKVTPRKILLRDKGRKNEVSKRIGLVAVLALVLVLGLASVVLAAQNSDYSGSSQDGINDFAATPILGSDGQPIFKADGTSQYPNELYLPNETNPGQYHIHSNYTSSTDACASCHSTHTAVGGALLQFGSSTDLCMACHDGSIASTYNVEEGKIGATGMATAGGLFGDSKPNTGASKSVHNVMKESMSVYAAPGGPGSAGLDANNEENPWDPEISWNIEFGCESCHSPHGTGGNARILNPDVNGYAQTAYAKGGYRVEGGINVGGSKGVPLYKAEDGTYYSNWKKVDANEKDQWLWSGHAYKNNTKVYVNTGIELKTLTLDTDYHLDNTKGYTRVTFEPGRVPEGAAVTADIYPGVRVQMKITDYLQANEKVQHVSGLNDFCGACHTDYNTSTVSGPDSNLNGTYTEAYRHKVNFTRKDPQMLQIAKYNMPLETRDGKNYVTCETCHVAHGTDQAYWLASLSKSNGGVPPTGLDQANLVEISGSSALKRVPNMGTCEACHAKGLAAQGYAANSGFEAGQISVPTQEKNAAPGGGYVGSPACSSCHANTSEHFSETWHSSMSRPGVTKATWDSVKGSLVKADGSINEEYVPVLDAKTIEGYAEALYTTMKELGDNMWDAKGAIITDPAVWGVKGINPANIQVWTTGTTAQELIIRGSALGKSGVDADKWYIVAFWGRVDCPNDFLPAGEEEDYTCGATAFGCHTTGKATATGSQDMTAWLNAAVTGTQPFELGVGCETCHGQGGNHVKNPVAATIVNPARFTAVEQTVGLGATKVGTQWTQTGATKWLNQSSGAMACGMCHRGANHQGDYYSTGNYKSGDPTTAFAPGEHFYYGIVSCNNCHDTHQESKGLIAYGTSQQVCESCHGKIADFNLSTYMPPLLKNANMHQHQFNTGKPPHGTANQSEVGRRAP